MFDSNMEQEFAPEVEEVLREAGWFPGRRVSEKLLQEWEAFQPMFPVARQVLEEFGDLYVKKRGRTFFNKEKGCIDEENFRHSFCIDPPRGMRHINAQDGDDSWEEYFGCRAYDIGMLSYHTTGSGEPLKGCSGLDELVLDERGRVFATGYMCLLIGSTIHIALHNLVTGSGWQRWDLEKDAPRDIV